MNASKLVDKAGALRAQVADLQDQLKAIEDQLKALPDGAYEGAKYRATISRYSRTTVDWKSVAAKLNPSRQLVTAYSKDTEVTTLKVVARLAQAA